MLVKSYIYIYLYIRRRYNEETKIILCYSEFRACALIRQYLMKNKPIKLYIIIHASIVYKKQGSAVLITIRCEKTGCEKKANRVLFSWRHLEISSDLLFRSMYFGETNDYCKPRQNPK